jgi:hypothetical protein
MYTRSWLIIKDERARTFEVVMQAANDNAFSNKIYAMQKAGMLVGSLVLPASNKNSSKDSIKLTGFTREDGLYDRLLKQHQAIALRLDGFWED